MAKISGIQAKQVHVAVEHKVLVLKPSALGDIAMTLPAARSIKRGLPGARVYWLVNKGLTGLLEGNPNVDEVIEFDRQTLGRMWYSPAAWEEFGKLVKKLRSEKFDVVMDFQGLLRTALLGRLSGCKARVGMKDAREGATFFYTDVVAKPLNSEHVVDYYAAMVEALWVEAGKPTFEFVVSHEVQAQAAAVLKKEGVAGKYAVIVAGASDEAKRWPLERYAQLAEKIAHDYGLAVVATGSTGEEEIVNRLAKLARIGIVKLAGRTNLPELVAVLKGATLVVGNDTGPTHIAAGLGIPTVVVFGGINPARLYPYGRRECVAAVEPWSRPTGIRSEDEQYRVGNVTFEMVWERVVGQMKGQMRPVQ
jgi:lipopolysaccharide heptosyltransferase I